MVNEYGGGVSDGAHSDAILERLLALHPKKIDLSLGRLERLLARLGHPERALPPVVHVAGTNGKGSVCSYLRAGLEATGAAVHVYTSPHLVRFHERIRLAGRLIDEALLAALLAECEEANGDEPITFFEVTTAAAFLAFARVPADWLVLEVGLGGRLDATNVIGAPRVSVITNIDRDHEEFLGPTIGAIAAEKAGILKPGAPCVVAGQHDEALAVIEHRAAELNAPLARAGAEWSARAEDGRLLFENENGLFDLPMPRLPGRHQVENAGVAVAAMTELELPETAIAAGLAKAEWPARLQKISRGPLIELGPEPAEIWIDGGHNAAAGAAVASFMADLQEQASTALYMICGMMANKDADAYLAPFVGLVKKVITVPIPDQPGAADAGALAGSAVRVGLTAQTSGSLEGAVRQVVNDMDVAWLDRPPRILICGSLYLAGVALRDSS